MVSTKSAVRYLLFIIAIISLSQAGIMTRWASAPVEVIGFWRLILAAGIMAAISYKNKSLHELTRWQTTTNQANTRAISWAIASGCLFFLHLWSFMWAAQNTKIAHLMIIFASNPLFTAIGSRWILHQEWPKKLWISYPLAVLGLIVLFKFDGSGSEFFESLTAGDGAALLGALFYSAYMVAGHKARSVLANTNYTFLAYTTSGLLFAAMMIFRHLSFFNWPQQAWLGILGVLVFSTLLGHAPLTYLLNYININVISTGKLAEPILASLVAWVVFDEALSSRQWLSFALTITALLILFEPWKVNWRIRKNSRL